MSKHIGTVIQVMGPVLDIRFPDGQLPALLSCSRAHPRSGRHIYRRDIFVGPFVPESDVACFPCVYPGHIRDVCPQLGYRDVPTEGRKPRLVHGYGSRHIQHLGARTDQPQC